MTILLELIAIIGFFPMVKDEHSRSGWISKQSPSPQKGSPMSKQSDRSKSFGMAENSLEEKEEKKEEEKISYFSF